MKVIIIGANAAGMSALSQIKREKDKIKISIYEKGDYISYSACGMPYYIEGTIKERKELIVYTPEEAMKNWDTDIKIKHEVININTKEKKVTIKNLKNNETFEDHYDKLILGLGASPRKLDIEGNDLNNIFYLRTLNDAQKIKKAIDNSKNKDVLVVGSGHIGMEMAYSFLKNEMKVTVIEATDKICGIEPEFAQPIIDDLIKQGIKFKFNNEVEKFIGDENGNVEYAVIDGKKQSFSIVLICIGVTANIDPIKDTDIKLGDTGNICVDEYMRTNLADIYAAGDCVEIRHIMTDETTAIPLALLANRSGRIAGNTLASDILKEKPEQSFKGTLGTGCAKIGDWEIASTGLTEEQAEKNKFKFFTLTDENNSKAHYYPGSHKMYIKIIVDKKTSKLIGVQMFGKDGIAHRINTFVAAITAGMTVEDIYNLDTAYAPPFSTVYDPTINICGKAILKINE